MESAPSHQVGRDTSQSKVHTMANGYTNYINTNNSNNRGRGRGSNRGNDRGSNRGNNRGNNNVNRGNSINWNNSSNRGRRNNNGNNSNSSSNRGRGNNRGNNNRRGNRAGGGRGGRGNRGRGGRNSDTYKNRSSGSDNDSDEVSSHSTNESNSNSEQSDDDQCITMSMFLSAHLTYLQDEHNGPYIWHGPAPVMTSLSGYRSSLFNLEHKVAAWQRVKERLDLPWPPTIYDASKECDLIESYLALKAIHTDVQIWENTLQRVWQRSLGPCRGRDDLQRLVDLLLMWSVTRLQYYRALYPVMDAYKFEYSIKDYYYQADILMDTKGPSHQQTLQLLQAMEANPTTNFKDTVMTFFEKNSQLSKDFSETKYASSTSSSSTAKHQIEPSECTPIHKKPKMEQTSATLSRAGASNMTQDAAVIPTTPLPITVPTPTTQPSGNTTSTALLSGSNATAKTPAPSFMSFAPLPTKPIVTRTLTPPTPTNPPTTSLSIPPALQGASLQKVTPPWTIISSVLQDTPSLSTSSQPALLLTSAVHTTPTQTYSPQATPDPPTISPLRPQPVFLAQATKTSDVRYPNPVSSVSPQYTSLPKTGASSNIATATSAVASKVQLAPKKASSVRVAHLKRQERSHSPELGEIVSDKEDTEKEDFNTTSTGKVTSQVQRDVAEGRKPGVQQNIQQKLQLATTERALQDKGNADEIIGALTGSVSLQDTPDALVVSRPVLALEPQDYHPSQPSKQSPQQQQQQSPQQQYQEPKPIAVVNTARAEVNPTILLHDIKIWMEIETKKRKDDSALLERLVIKNTVLEAKLDEHISKMEQETKRQESHRAITHSRNQDISSLKEQSLAQDLKMSQMENQVEARMRQMLQQDLQVVRNALQEERVDNLAKDLEVKRAEAMETMAKARAEMLDARQMVAEAREERANAMERAAKAEADNQMLLRVINELQGTGWRLSEQGQGQSHSDGQFLDAGVQGYGRLPSIPSAATVLYPELQFDHRLRQLAPGSPLSRFMRFGTEMQQSFSSSSTESLVEPTATAATAHDPKFKRMEMASVKLENELISHPHVDPDMTEDDEGRTDTDGDATEEE